MARSKLTAEQIAKNTYDDVTNTTRVSMPALTTEMEISAQDGDSVRVWDGEEVIGYDYYAQVLSAGDTVVTTTFRSGGPTGTILGTTVKTYSSNARTFLVSFLRS